MMLADCQNKHTNNLHLLYMYNVIGAPYVDEPIIIITVIMYDVIGAPCYVDEPIIILLLLIL